MSVDERERHALYTALEASIGPESTSTLMSLLPPVGWADVATKQDLTSLENALRAEIGGLRGDLRAEFHSEIRSLTADLHTSIRTAVFSMIGAMFTLAALTWAAISIT